MVDRRKSAGLRLTSADKELADPATDATPETTVVVVYVVWIDSI